jgi:hypothetical protein
VASVTVPTHDPRIEVAVGAAGSELQDAQTTTAIIVSTSRRVCTRRMKEGSHDRAAAHSRFGTTFEA